MDSKSSVYIYRHCFQLMSLQVNTLACKYSNYAKQIIDKDCLKRLPGVSMTRLAILRGEGHHRQPTWGGHADCSSVVDTLDTNKGRAGVLPLIYIRFVQFTLICD